MRKKANYILMADVIGSRKADQMKILKEFRNITGKVNQDIGNQLLSPITITLGDEFQSVAKDLQAALSIIFSIEETIIKTQTTLKLRYVLVEGLIETPINPQIAYGMLGSGLTAAREKLIALKKKKQRFNSSLQNKSLEKAINNTFVVLQAIIDSWKLKKDYYVVAEFLKSKDYKKVAVDLNKERSLIWKREKSLKIEEYFALKEVIHYLGTK
ncbi:MAG TPA: SatD family protein [Puia sp.]|nr:SatD family protein [Puia sp.]